MFEEDILLLKKVLENNNVEKSEIENLDFANIALFLNIDNKKSLQECGIDEIIGYSEGDFIEKGQVFENPFNKYTYLEVIEFDAEADRAFLEIRDGR